MVVFQLQVGISVEKNGLMPSVRKPTIFYWYEASITKSKKNLTDSIIDQSENVIVGRHLVSPATSHHGACLLVNRSPPMERIASRDRWKQQH